MIEEVILDTSVLSLVADRPGKTTTVTAAQDGLTGLLAAGVKIYVPEICDYELRCELTRAQKINSLKRLDTVVLGAEYIAITTPIMREAAELWAIVRRSGNPTADDTALDGDIILCAQVLRLGLAAGDYAVATTNTKHLVLFVTASEWLTITI